MTLLKLLATLGLLFSREPAPEPSMETRPTVGVPFGCGLKFEVSQAHDTGSHLHNDTWAWDFRMPEGVPIVASKGGVVRMARGDSTIGGCDPKYAKYANYVVVDHGDGTEAQYLHFSSVTVQAGQKVNQGELLGYSGNTGWSCGPHLHFKIARREHNGWNNPSIPAFIDGYGDPKVRTVLAAPACAVPRPETIHAEATGEEKTDSKTGERGVVSASATASPRADGAHVLNDVTPTTVTPTIDQAAGEPSPAPVDVAPETATGYTGSGNAAR